MHGLSDDRNCEKTCIFVGAFGSRSILFVDRIWYLYFCAKKGVAAPVNLNFLSIGTGALLGLPGIVILYATAVLLFR